MAAAALLCLVLAFVAFLIWNRTRSGLERRRLHLEAQTRVLDKIGSGQTLTEFLGTEEGRRFLAELSAAELPRNKDVRGRIFVLVTFGLITFVGGVLVVGGALIPSLLVSDPEIPVEVMMITALPALLLGGAGLGALVAAGLIYRWSKRQDEGPGAPNEKTR